MNCQPTMIMAWIGERQPNVLSAASLFPRLGAGDRGGVGGVGWPEDVLVLPGMTESKGEFRIDLI